jgi:DNA modification methylase
MNHFIQADTIIVKANRQRREFTEREHQELMTSFLGVGQLHPLVLRVEGDNYTLVAGERRLRAIKELHELERPFRYGGTKVPLGMAPFVSLGELPPLEAMEAELEENIRRKDLTWQERAEASAALFEFRQAQAQAQGKPVPQLAAVALEIAEGRTGGPANDARKEIILAKHLDDPDVAKATSVAEAFKVLKKKEETKQNQILAATVGKTFTAAMHQLANDDCRRWMSASTPDSYDVILTDPPYGMGADDFGDSGVEGTRVHAYSDGAEVVQDMLEWLPQTLFRVAKPQAHLYLFCDPDWFHSWSLRMADAGWKVFRTPLIWVNPNGWRAPWPTQGPQRKWQAIFYAVKGDRQVNHMAGDVLTFPMDTAMGHAAQKPVALYEELLKRSAKPGDTVLDPFCGTGPIFPAAHGLKCIAHGVEQDPATYGIALTRMKVLK